jgi:tRNA A37 threonylcarbamoyladenosine dehydratase
MSNFDRAISLIGKEKFECLKKSTAVILGLGGVGSYAAEALARSGIGKLILADFDVIEPSNINRQLYALSSTIGQKKIQVAKERIHDINSACDVQMITKKITKENIAALLADANADIVLDAIDDIYAKIACAIYCDQNNTELISCMGTGNKLDPLALRVADISDTRMCPLAKKVRNELRKAGVKKLKVVFSIEEPLVKTFPPASMMFVPASAGILMAKEAMSILLGKLDSQ